MDEPHVFEAASRHAPTQHGYNDIHAPPQHGYDDIHALQAPENVDIIDGTLLLRLTSRLLGR